MIITINSAQYANAEHTSAILQTEEHGATACSLEDTPELWAQLQESELPIGAFAPEPEPPRTSSALAFVELFTDEEQLGIAAATLQSPVVKLWYDKLMAADIVVYNDERLIVGMQALVDNQLITAQRRDEILGVESEEEIDDVEN